MNGKNGYGAYVGYEDYAFVIGDDGKVTPLQRVDRFLENPDAVRKECALPADPG